MDLWLTKDISGLEERNQFYLKYSERIAGPAFLKRTSLVPTMTQDPRTVEAMEALSKK